MAKAKRWFAESPCWRKLATVVAAFFILALILGLVAGEEETGETKAGGEPNVAKQPTPELTADTRLEEIRRSLQEGFGRPGIKATWYDSIKRISISGRTLVVQTDLFEDAEGREFAAPICSALSGNYVYATTAPFGLKTVRVLGKTGKTLALRTSLADTCAP